MKLRPNRQRRLVFYIGSIEAFRGYVDDQLEQLRDVNTGELVVTLTARAGRDYSIQRGRRFIHLGTGRGPVTNGMRGLSACAVDVVYGVDHRASDATRELVAQCSRLIILGVTADERERETNINEAMRETGEPYEIIVELIEAMDACNDYPPELT